MNPIYPSELSLEEQIAICRMDLADPELPTWARGARMHQLAAIESRQEQELADLERLYVLADPPPPPVPWGNVMCRLWQGLMGLIIAGSLWWLVVRPLLTIIKGREQ